MSQFRGHILSGLKFFAGYVTFSRDKAVPIRRLFHLPDKYSFHSPNLTAALDGSFTARHIPKCITLFSLHKRGWRVTSCHHQPYVEAATVNGAAVGETVSLNRARLQLSPSTEDTAFGACVGRVLQRLLLLGWDITRACHHWVWRSWWLSHPFSKREN